MKVELSPRPGALQPEQIARPVADGDKYVGEWKDGRKHGQGTLNVFDGSKYVGEFKDDKPNGQRRFDGDVEIVRSSRVYQQKNPGVSFDLHLPHGFGTVDRGFSLRSRYSPSVSNFRSQRAIEIVR